MWRGWYVLLAGLVGAVLLGCPAAAAAPVERAEPISRADSIAAALARDPVYVTDHAPRSLPPDTAARIKASVAELGVPTYVAVTPTVNYGTDPGDSLVPLLRDRLRKDGIYIVVDPSGGHGEARQFGGTRRLPVDDAWWAADFEMPYDATAPEVIARFVEIALSGHARERRDHPRPAAKSETRKALDADDAADRRAAYIEWGVFSGATVLSGGTILGLLIWNRIRRSKPKPEPKPKPKPTAKKRPAKQKSKGRR